MADPTAAVQGAFDGAVNGVKTVLDFTSGVVSRVGQAADSFSNIFTPK
jgi:hypothetical protein